ncbi:ABC transporter permease [Rufibacter sediminis]|uniref:Transport permease protein n=1 Tax=Rufibacter sediminis TaxID=2762756 RepID=A0ABR6VNI2_9BACT|nr:ABC transporter permease [Rufibacter sediminis]MBC3538722.1 ABC transporter permease [Rufibacter sediminis]
MIYFSTNRAERLWLLAKIEFKLRYYENKLGLLWALIKPITDITIYYIAFNVVIKQNIPSFVAYLFSGLILWNFFLESTTGTVQILRTKKFLYEYNNMQKIDIYISTLLANSIGLFFNICMFFAYFFLIDKEGDNLHLAVFSNYIYLIPVFFNLFLLSIAFSLVLSTLYVFMHDIHQIWQVVAGLFFILTPIVFKTEDYLRALPVFAELNPMAGIIINFRRIVLQNTSPDFYLLMLDLGYAMFLFLLGLFLLKRIGSKAAEKL